MILILILLLTLLEFALQMMLIGAKIRNRVRDAEKATGKEVSTKNESKLYLTIKSKVNYVKSKSENTIKAVKLVVVLVRNSLLGVGIVVLLIELLVILLIVVAVAAYLLLLSGGKVPPVS